MSPSDELLERAFLDDACVEAGWRGAATVVPRALELEAAHAGDPSAGLRAIVRAMGEAGLTSIVTWDVSWRSVCLARERLGYASPLLYLAFAMQGLGSYPITLAGTDAQRARHLPAVRSGERVMAFALTEPEAGSDLSRIATTARRDGDAYVLDGHKALISNAPIADTLTVFAATAPPGERRRISAFVVRRDTPGVRTEATEVLGGHPIGEVFFEGARVPVDERLGDEGDGMRIALGTLHCFRTTVGAAALGFGQRALDEAVRHVRSREQFGGPLADLQAVQVRVADMACALEGARLLTYRAAWIADRGDAGRAAEARAASMGKLRATEAAFEVIDQAVQLHGGRGVVRGSPVARLYEDARALRIYEGTSDVQRLLIARALLSR